MKNLPPLREGRKSLFNYQMNAKEKVNQEFKEDVLPPIMEKTNRNDLETILSQPNTPRDQMLDSQSLLKSPSEQKRHNLRTASKRNLFKQKGNQIASNSIINQDSQKTQLE